MTASAATAPSTSRVGRFNLTAEQIRDLLTGRIRLTEKSRHLFENAHFYRMHDNAPIWFATAPAEEGVIEMGLIGPNLPEVGEGDLMPFVELEFQERDSQ